jgi:hypothetical protein
MPASGENPLPPRPPAILVDPTGAQVTPQLLAAIREELGERDCGVHGDCRLYFRPEEHAVIVLVDDCALLRRRVYADLSTRQSCRLYSYALLERDGRWRRAPDRVSDSQMTPAQERDSLAREGEAILNGQVEIRHVERRQLFVAGKPVNEPFE